MSHGRFKPLSLSSLAVAPSLPDTQRHARPEDPALSLLTDLCHSACVVAGHRDRLDQTLHLMMRAGVRMVFVAGADGALVGMVTAEDLQGERPVVRASSHHVPHSELTVSDVMVPLHRWPTVDLGRVRTARLGEIAATMHEHGLRYLLVTQTKHGQTTLRGLFSASRLERAMQTVIDSDLHSQSFAELEMALAHA
ncbi:CBS domain-containing protein [Aquabacterium sp. A3]|uniref:CBS domain-containing protein n=1 Tax=Aquabacterium sp. A3 TaxID=3132829 RepID=UPI003119F0A1